ncbi:MAG: 2Fe-2S iron-sulfur cluster binding domain-containing protein [Geminicoccaceae bacterium]|nr:2Fe-2S iron-sulfur cluster binding domain-containing protein [Geminicoccaceae bacterium]
MPSVSFELPDGSLRKIDVERGVSVLEAARLADVPIEGACGGSMACATCHVHVDAEQFGELPEPSFEEDDMLDLAADLSVTSRLGCQIRVERDLKVHVPGSSMLG